MNKKLQLLHLIYFLFSFVANYGQVTIWNKSSRQQKNITSLQTNDSLYNLDIDLLLQAIKSKEQIIISFPDQNNKVVNFKIKQTQTLAPSLQKKYASIYSFKGIATDGSGKTLRFTFSKEFGLKGSINDNNKSRLNIKPNNNTEHLFSIEDKTKVNPYECYTDEILINQFNFHDNTTKLDVNDSKLRRYRIAVSTTAEYSNFFLDGNEINDTEKITKVLTAVSASIERINELFEIDLGITLQLIDNNDQLIFLNTQNDPYGFDLNFELQNELDNNEFIGNDAYDVGHLFHYDGNTYGNAGCIACVCLEGKKGSGFTAHQDPSSDGMNIILAHELGHQFGAYHTQSSTNCSSGLNSEVEPGSGSTIMSYAGICFPNVQNEADFYYNYTSIRDISQWVIQDSNCAEIIDVNNDAPVISAGDNYIIPISTPFILTAEATDPNPNDILTYCWEQSNADTPFSGDYPSSTQTLGPVFRSFLPSLDNKRYFPELTHVVNGTNAEWEVLPEVSRSLNFSLTVRDNSIEGGQTVTDLMEVTITDESGPFSITSQNTTDTVWNVGEEVTVTWNVANTNIAPVNTALIDIYISIDGGLSFNTKILENTENDGEASFILPNVASTNNARIMIKAVNNIYYSINSSSFQVQESEFIISSPETEIESCNLDSISYELNYKTFLGFNETVNIFIEELPLGLNYELSQSFFTNEAINGLDFSLIITGAENLEIGNYSLFVKGVSETAEIEKRIELKFNIYENLENTQISLTSPIDNANSVSIPTILDWLESDNATEYLLELSTFEDFSEIEFSTTTILNNFQIDNNEFNTEYFWRVTALNACDKQSDHTTFSFSTICTPPILLETNNINANSISIIWDDSTNSNWEIEYGESGFILGSGTTVEVFETSYTITELNSSTEYDIYLRSKCNIGGYSQYTKLTKISTTANYCAGDHFYDTGGDDEPYSDLENYTVTITPNHTTERVKAVFEYINLETNYDYLFVYNGDSTSNELIGSFNGNYNNIELISTHSSGALTFNFISDGSVVLDGWDAEIFCEPKPNCLAPLNSEIINITTESAQFNWEAADNETNWKIEYGIAGFIRGEGEIVNTSETFINLTNLNSNTPYDIYLETICTIDGFSETISSSFLTKADYCGGEHFYDNGGPDNNYIAENNYLTTIYPDNEGYRIRALFNYIDIANNDFLLIYNGENNFSEFLGFYSGSYSNVEIISTDPSGALTFEFISNSSITSQGWDSEIFCEIKPCESPTNIESTLINSSSLSIEWTTHINDVNSIIEYGPEGFTLGNGTELTTNINNITIENLESNTTYDIYIKNSCINEGYSDYSIVKSFTTQGDYCSGDHFYDTGGEFGNYNNSENYTQTIYPEETGDRIRAIFNLFDLESCCDRLYIYDGPSNNDKLLGLYTSTSPGEVFSSHESGALTFVFTSDGSVTRDGWDAKIICEDQPNCEPPINFITTNTTASSAQIEWEIEGTDASWSIEYGPLGFTKGTGTIEIVQTNSINISDLMSFTDYEIYVNTICELGGISNLISFNFKTAADYCAGDHFYDTGGPFSTYENGENYVETIYPNDKEEDRIKVIFDSFSTFNGDTLYVYDGPDTDANLLAELSGNIYTNPEYKSSHETGALTFVFISDNFSSTSGWDAEVICEVKPSCSAPSNVEITNITVNTSEISWIQEGDHNVSSWTIEYGTSGFTRGNGTTIISNTNNVNLFFLDSATAYDIYITAVCNDETNSDFKLISFSTLSDYCAGDAFYDTGGDFETYENNENYLKTINPNNLNERVRAEFTYFNTENLEDILYIYDGIDTSGQLLAELSGFISEDLEFISSHESGALTFNFISNESNNFNGWVANITCETRSNCNTPVNFSISEIDSTTVLLEWDEVTENSDGYRITYGFTDFNFDNGSETIITTLTNSIEISNIQSGSLYDFYIETECTNDTFSDALMKSFQTTIDYCGGSHFYDTGGINGNYQNNENYTKTIYPDSDLEVVRILFSYIETENSYDYLYVYDGENTDANLLGTYSGSYTNIEHVSTHSTGALTFNFTSDGSVIRSGWDATIICESTQNCKLASDLIVSNITSNSAYLSWIEGERSLNWFVEYGENGFTPNTSDGIEFLVVSTTHIELENLKPNFIYDIYITTECDYGGLTSDTYGPITFITKDIALSNVDNVYLKNNITLFPTPNNGTFTISNNKDININKITVYDILGRFIQKNTYGVKSDEELFTINNAASGVYFLNIETDKGDAIFKTIVE